MPKLLSSEVEINLLSVLLLEDDCDDTEIIESIIKDLSPKTKVVCHEDAEEAFHYLENLAFEEYPALIILDYNLPKITGIEFLKMIRKDEKYVSIPVVMYTTSQQERHRQEALELGCCSFNVKKNTIPEIVNDVREMLSFSRFPLI